MMLYHLSRRLNDDLVFPVSFIFEKNSYLTYVSCIYKGRVMKEDDYNLMLKYIIL